MLISEQEFADTDAAVLAYEEHEARYDANDKIEVVLIGSDSIETVRQTHANYFDGTAALSRAVAEILKSFARDVSLPLASVDGETAK
jgi:hypothetical protein